jgi:hypothetical protein
MKLKRHGGEMRRCKRLLRRRKSALAYAPGYECG